MKRYAILVSRRGQSRPCTGFQSDDLSAAKGMMEAVVKTGEFVASIYDTIEKKVIDFSGY